MRKVLEMNFKEVIQSKTLFIDKTNGETFVAFLSDGESIEGGKAENGKTIKQNAIIDIERLLKAGHTIEHTGAIEVEGSTEFIDWSADYELAEEFEDGSAMYQYAKWSEDGNKVRGTLERVLMINGVKAILSSKKTYRTP
jgi:hypothetical protein